ncbi:energy transducer TonB [Silanimonas sp.]|jgi:hypothetical protein|uniref:energy transducer TonB n=1 Tax=Silanimonas sp. TaxID=1929290 RepID=UPI0022C915F0|nr:energy transducer TonB [Silanimonas sp.]MCZ8115786.1 energy transducer TonB [Silanimonas sp.]
MRWMFALALALAPSAPAWAAGSGLQTDRLEAEARGTLTIEPDGRVSDVTLPEALDPALAEAFGGAIRRWRFEPIVLDGRAVRAQGHMELRLSVEFQDQRLVGAGIERVVFTDPPVAGVPVPVDAEGFNLRPPRYPEDLAIRGVGGEVMLMVETDGDGRVERVAAVSGQLYASVDRRGESEARSAFKELARESVRAASTWRIDGCRASRCSVPVHFFPPGLSPNAFWRPAYRVPVVPEPWTQGDGDIALGVGGTAPSARFKPTTPVDGPVLDTGS